MEPAIGFIVVYTRPHSYVIEIQTYEKYKCRKINNDITIIYNKIQHIVYIIIRNINLHQHMVLCKITKRKIPMALQINDNNVMINIRRRNGRFITALMAIITYLGI